MRLETLYVSDGRGVQAADFPDDSPESEAERLVRLALEAGRLHEVEAILDQWEQCRGSDETAADLG